MVDRYTLVMYACDPKKKQIAGSEKIMTLQAGSAAVLKLMTDCISRVIFQFYPVKNYYTSCHDSIRMMTSPFSGLKIVFVHILSNFYIASDIKRYWKGFTGILAHAWTT